MIAFAFYSVCVSVSLSVLWALWRLTGLRAMTSFVLNRIVLLSILVFSLLIGFIPFIDRGMADGIIPEVFINEASRTAAADEFVAPEGIEGAVMPSGSAFYVGLVDIMIDIYYLGLLIAVLLYLRALYSVIRMIADGRPIEGYPRHIRVTPFECLPFAWGGFMVIGKRDWESRGSLLVTHEESHLRAFHWLDLFLANAVRCIAWYAPPAYLLLNDLAENHEFFADKAVIDRGFDSAAYQMVLIEKSSGRRFANSVSDGVYNPYYLLKPRIIMMQKKVTDRRSGLRALWFLPALGALILTASVPALASLTSSMSRVAAADSVVISKKTVTEVSIVMNQDEFLKGSPKDDVDVCYASLSKKNVAAISSQMRYPSAAAEARKVASVVALVDVDKNGRVKPVRIINELSTPDFDESFGDAVTKCFENMPLIEPATYKGTPAYSQALIRVTFALQGEGGMILPEKPATSAYEVDEILVLGY